MQRARARWTSYVIGEDEIIVDTANTPFWRRHIAKVGGITIFIYKFIRLCAVLALTGLMAYTTIKEGWTNFDIALIATLVRF